MIGAGGARPEVLAVIPARGGSKGLPRKNLLDLGGLPLIAWSIRAALACKAVTRVVLSTEDEEIAAVAREHGAEVPFMRPMELAGDRSLPHQAVTHALDRLRADEGYEPAAYCTLYPTHPFRPAGLVAEAVALALEAYSPVVAARALGCGSYLAPDGDGWRALDLGGPAWRTYGLVEAKSLVRPLRGVRLLPVDDPVALVDIDTRADLDLAREAVRAGLAAPPEVAR